MYACSICALPPTLYPRGHMASPLLQDPDPHGHSYCLVPGKQVRGSQKHLPNPHPLGSVGPVCRPRAWPPLHTHPPPGEVLPGP